MMEHFLITGMSRSGTTLLEKLLASHQELRVLSQPLPLLYRYFKQQFFYEINYPETRYVLNDLFNEERYSHKDFRRFLSGYEISREEIDHLFKEMKNWEGQWFKVTEIKKWLNTQETFRLIDFYTFFLDQYTNQKKILGTKEVLIEEFIPYLLENDVKVIQLFRDPRDVITSINFGDGPKYTGAHRPTLFHLRNWRKSVAISNTYKNSKGLFRLKYEDLISAPHYTLAKITEFLNVKPFEENHFQDGIKTADGKQWSGNSSTVNFNGINKNNKNKYLKKLSPSTIAYIEYTCAPEMQLLGYDLTDSENPDNFTPKRFVEPFESEVDDIPKNFSTLPAQLALEKERRNLLKSQNISVEKMTSYFFSEANYEILKGVKHD
ncbi:MAG: sulfotransferase [Gracilimonas sp.]